MKLFLIFAVSTLAFTSCTKEGPTLDDPEDDATSLYFPPNGEEAWDLTAPSDLGWDEDALEELYTFMEESDTRAFMILKDGRIVAERYWNKSLIGLNFTSETNWYWASAAKSLTSFLVGQGVTQGNIDLEKSSQEYLGKGWSSLSDDEEKAITVRHHLTMTTGLDESMNADCTDAECLTFQAPPGERWAYHNAPYTILDGVIEGATGMEFDVFFEENLKEKIGMDGFWTYQNYNHLYFSTARSMARYGLLVMNGGKWKDEQLIDPDYLVASTTTSQDINQGYGYLWWINGATSIMLPGTQLTFNRPLAEGAPDEMFAAIGKNSQIINIVPSQGLVIIRMGGDPDDALVPLNYQDEMWELLNKVIK